MYNNIEEATREFIRLNYTGESLRLSAEMLESIYTQWKDIRRENPGQKDIFVYTMSRGGNTLAALFTKLKDGTEVVDLVYNPND